MPGNLDEMKEDLSPSLVIDDRKAAQALVDLSVQRFLAPFIGRELTISQAARELRISSNSLLYRVKNFVKLGLLEVSQQKSRPGRTMNIYRSTAKSFFIPFNITDATTIEAFLYPVDAHWHKIYVENAAKFIEINYPEIGLAIWRGDTGDIYTKITLGPDRFLEDLPEIPALIGLWAPKLYLDEQDARSFQQELIDLYLKYQKSQGKQQYIAHLALVPWLTD